MKVTGHTPTDLLTPKSSANNTPKAQPDVAKAATRAVTDPSVAVVLSGSKGLVRDAQNTASVVDAKKVATMKAAIANGTFKPNPEAIADKLLSNAQELLDAQPR